MLLGRRAKKTGTSLRNSKSKSIGLKKVLLLPTLPTIPGTMKDDTKRKPAIYKQHDFIKRRTNVMDRRIGTYMSGKSLDAGQ